jgi:predicted GH43/DUF377 family glycosyl hydrolase
MAKTTHIPPSPQARRKRIVLNANISRVITRPYIPPTKGRITNIIDRVLALSEDDTQTLLDDVMHDFSHRHRYFREALLRNFENMAPHVPDVDKLSKQRKLLIGAYFTAEYSVEAAALFNPSMVQVPSLETDPEGSCRFIISFRVVGEGHISSIEFRSGIVDSNNDIYFDPMSDYVRTPKIKTNSSYNKALFCIELQDMGASDSLTDWLLDRLPDNFTFNELEERISEHVNGAHIRERDKTEVIDMAIWLARSNYEILFRAEHQISERVIFPVSESESGGIEDARFVRFVDDDGNVTYYATYTAYNGQKILPQIIKTRDFLTFRCSTLNGKQAYGKGMALFPRKVGGKYVMLSRQDGENNAIMFSDNVHVWDHAEIIQKPMFPHEFFQIGNGGSPIETPDGWLVITHGVGAMRTYSLSIELLDLDDPTRVISRLDKPILLPNEHDRDGYVPNVVYSCGAMVFQGELIIPYASADQRCGIATLNMTTLMARLRYKKTLKEKESK